MHLAASGKGALALSNKFAARREKAIAGRRKARLADIARVSRIERRGEGITPRRSKGWIIAEITDSKNPDLSQFHPTNGPGPPEGEFPGLTLIHDSGSSLGRLTYVTLTPVKAESARTSSAIRSVQSKLH